VRGEECIHNMQHGPHTIQYLPESGHSRSLSSDAASHVVRLEGGPQGYAFHILLPRVISQKKSTHRHGCTAKKHGVESMTSKYDINKISRHDAPTHYQALQQMEGNGMLHTRIQFCHAHTGSSPKRPKWLTGWVAGRVTGWVAGCMSCVRGRVSGRARGGSEAKWSEGQSGGCLRVERV
jgi:competence protein ComGC